MSSASAPQASAVRMNRTRRSGEVRTVMLAGTLSSSERRNHAEPSEGGTGDHRDDRDPSEGIHPGRPSVRASHASTSASSWTSAADVSFQPPSRFKGS